MGNFIRSTQISGSSFLKPTTLVQPIINPPLANVPPTPISKTTPSQSGVHISKQGSAVSTLKEGTFEPQNITVATQQADHLKSATTAEVKIAVEKATNKNYARVKKGATENRHELNQRLQLQDPSKPRSANNLTHYDGADVVVISFEGTAAFEPRRLQIMEDAAANLKAQGLKSDDLYDPTTEAIKDKNGETPNWSGMNIGVHTEILKDGELQERVQMLSFPSEESELFKGEVVKDTFGGSYVMDSLKEMKNPLSKLTDEIIGSTVGRTPGIDNALIAMHDIQAQAKAMGKSPKFVIVGHSSGGRSMVKFLEEAKAIKDKNGDTVKFDLAISIDPMMEAHEAAMIGVGVLAEQAEQWLSNGTLHNINKFNPLKRFTGDIVDVPKYKEAVVGYTTNTSGSLYTPDNVKQGMSYSFHQRADTNGLGMGFGIQGVKVVGAKNQLVEYKDKDKEIPLAADGHGVIAYSHPVKKVFTDGVRGLLRLP